MILRNCKVIIAFLQVPLWIEVKFIYSEKAQKFSEISTVDLSYVVPVKYTVEISQNFAAFSEYMNFKRFFIISSIPI